LAGEDRVIVSEIPGTTRDAIDVRFELGGQPFLAIDTAGVRKKSRIKDSIEFYSLSRAERSVRRADVILLMIDAAEPVGQITKRLGGYIVENYKPCVIVVNKYDLAAGKASLEDYGDYLGKQLSGLRFAPIAMTSGRDGTNVRETIKLAGNLFEQASTRVPTGQLNAVIERIRTEKPPSSSKAKGIPRFYYASQIDICPPTIVLFVNDRQAYTEGYQRYLINRFRELLPFKEVPIRLLIRERTRSI
jgi:GTP-binding protein